MVNAWDGAGWRSSSHSGSLWRSQRALGWKGLWAGIMHLMAGEGLPRAGPPVLFCLWKSCPVLTLARLLLSTQFSGDICC